MRFLAQCGLAVRGHTKESGNLYHVLKLRSEDDSSLEKWLGKQINYTSPAIQNEILMLMANEVTRNIVSEVNSESVFFGLIVDGTQDISGTEQECICIRFVD